MELSERKKKILRIAVDNYIDTAVPVSSKTIAEQYEGSISSATIRSEMSALEELGYLEQPHTSAGRIPSNEAYKLYVSELMVKEKPTVQELDYIKKIFLSVALTKAKGKEEKWLNLHSKRSGTVHRTSWQLRSWSSTPMSNSISVPVLKMVFIMISISGLPS